MDVQALYQRYFDVEDDSVEFQWTASLWAYRNSWRIYAGLIWLCLLSQFANPPLVCQSSQSHIEYEIAEAQCFFEAGFYPLWRLPPGNFSVDDASSVEEAIGEHFFNRIVYYLFPWLVVVVALLEMPSYIWNLSKQCRLLETAFTKTTIVSKRRITVLQNTGTRLPDSVVDQLAQKCREHVNKEFTFVLISMHLCSLAAIVFIAILMCLIFHGDTAILTYGFDVIKYSVAGDDDNGDRNPVHQLFPAMTKCALYHYGPLGSVRKIDLLCLIKINLLLDKMFLFIWLHLTALTGWIVLDLVWIVVPHCLCLSRRFGYFGNPHWKLLWKLLPINIGQTNTNLVAERMLMAAMQDDEDGQEMTSFQPLDTEDHQEPSRSSSPTPFDEQETLL